MDVENHVAGVIADDGGGVRGHVIEEGIDASHGVFGGVALLPRDFAKGDQDGGIDSPAVI